MPIEIYIEGGTVRVSGSSQHIITDADVRTFGVHEKALKNALTQLPFIPLDAIAPQIYQSILSARIRPVHIFLITCPRPDRIFLRSPTKPDSRWGRDPYISERSTQVQTVLEVRSFTILEKSSRLVMLDYQNLVNNTDTEATYTANMSLENTSLFSNTWSNTQNIKFEQKISYKVNLGIIAGGGTTLGYENSFGQDQTHSKSTTLIIAAGVSVVVGPHQSKHAILSASEERMRIQIKYDAHLTGSAIAKYSKFAERKFGERDRFCRLDIAELMRIGNISNTRTITEDIALQSYSNGSVVLGEGPAPISVAEAVKFEKKKKEQVSR